MSIIRITQIVRQKKDKSRFSVYINDKFSFGIGERDLDNYGLEEGMELSEKLYNSIIDDLVQKRADFLAIRYLSYKNRTEKEVYDKLRSYGEFNDVVINRAVEALKNKGIIDDARYAELFAEAKANGRLDGSYKIKYMLAQKGIKYEPDTERLEIDEVDNAITLIERKIRYLDELDYSDKKRIFNYLARKGYSYSIIKEAFKRVEEEYFEESD